MAELLLDYLDADWQRAVENVRQAAIHLWATPAYHHAVDCGPAHAARTLVLLNGLTGGLMAQGESPLSQEEIYVLLAAVYLHAIGLQDEQAEPDPALRWAHYPQLGAEMIYRLVESPSGVARLGLLADPGLIEMTALVIARHTAMVYPSPDYDDFPLGNVVIRPRLLTALLRLANGLDLDYRRVDMTQLNLMAVSPDEALDWWLHHYVSGVQVSDEYVRIGYRVPLGQAIYEKVLPELVEGGLRADFEALRDIFRLYGVKIDIGASKMRAMRAVLSMPAEVWAAAERRLARLQGVALEPPPSFTPLVETVRDLLGTMGYECDPPGQVGRPLTLFRCRPRGGGLRSPLVVGCKEGPAEVDDVQSLVLQLSAAYPRGYIVAEKRILPSAQEAALASGRVQLFTLAAFYRELLDFRAYVEKLVDEYERSDLARYYAPLGCVRYTYDTYGQGTPAHYKPMDDYVDAWLRQHGTGAERNHISVLGDYGTGKTSFCRQYAARQGRRWLADPDHERIPILINLRDYARTLDVDSLITLALVNQYDLRGTTVDAFMRYNAEGKLLILLDGFDEMTQPPGLHTAVDNFLELARVVVPGSKVILTCRTHYFRTQHEAEALLRSQLSGMGKVFKGLEAPNGDFIDLRDYPNFEIAYLEPFSDEDIQSVLRARFPEQWTVYWKQIQHIYNLPDLARRPVLLDMIARTLPELHPGQAINAARLYQVYTDLWLEWDLAKGRRLVMPPDRRLFAEELAIEMMRTGAPTIHYSRLPARVKQHFRLEKAEEIDYFDADVRTCNFLKRDEGGHYAFAHKSFMEFFAASRLHSLMLKDRAVSSGTAFIGEEVRRFLTELFALEPKTELPAPPAGQYGQPDQPPPGFAWVPPGEFIMGGGKGSPLQIACLEQGFWAARTPVTNAQYARFVTETGHAPPPHWGGVQPPLVLADHPVVQVSWYDAVAYARWAGARLPTEKEWEKAARGYDGREYPWGEWAENCCNTSETGCGGTSPVGRFSPQGDSPYGLQDMAGNVWEWTSSEWESGSPGRVLRSGSFNFFYKYAYCAYRNWDVPHSRWDVFGFRVVMSA